jgi:osmoprotectant transport system ATP-binding protein
MIEIRNLSKNFDGKAAVEDVSFIVEPRSFCALVGTSGSGKSTTLRMINRLIEPSAGQVLIDGEDVAGIPGDELRRRIGYAIQGIGLFPHRTVFENIATVPKLLGWSKGDIEQRVAELLELFHLDFDLFAHQMPRQLSGGQQQRVGVARALAAKPNLLLMDEPFGALDPITRDYLQGELLQIQKQLGVTIIMVTHDMEEAIRMADMIAVMDQGRLQQYASPQDLLRHPNEGYVKELVGGVDRSLRLLSLNKVEDVMEHGSNGATSAPLSLSRSDSARDALSALIWSKQDSLPVVDEEGVTVGQVDLASVIEMGGCEDG